MSVACGFVSRAKPSGIGLISIGCLELQVPWATGKSRGHVSVGGHGSLLEGQRRASGIRWNSRQQGEVTNLCLKKGGYRECRQIEAGRLDTWQTGRTLVERRVEQDILTELSPLRLSMVMEFCTGGDLFSCILPPL